MNAFKSRITTALHNNSPGFPGYDWRCDRQIYDADQVDCW